VTLQLIKQDKDFYQLGLEKLIYVKYLNFDRDYLEKQWDIGTIKSELSVLKLKIKNQKYMPNKHIS